MTADITTATAQDVAELRQLYFAVYGSYYNHNKLGTCPRTMTDLIADPTVTWLVARAPGTGTVVASVVLRRDLTNGIGLLEGAVVHPDHRVMGLASRMLRMLSTMAVGPEGELDSVYGECRLAIIGAQRILLDLGFRPLGLLPNATHFRYSEHLALMVRHREGVLDRRTTPAHLSAEIRPLLRTVERATDLRFGTAASAPEPLARLPRSSPVELEWIEATDFVRRRHRELHGTRGDAFYPFQQPNLMLTPAGGGAEVYACLDRGRLKCALVDIPRGELTASLLERVVEAVEKTGVRYVEALLPLHDHQGLHAFHSQGFTPSALYPAMRRRGDSFEDYVVLTRTRHYPDFRTVRVDPRLQPYFDHYRSDWTSTYLTATDSEESA